MPTGELGDFAPGYYAMSWDAVDCGLTEGPKRLRRRYGAIESNTDKYGDGVDGVVRQVGPVLLLVTLKEWTAQTRKVLWPFHATKFGAIAPNGRLLSALAKQLILTAEAGSPAAVLGPGTITADLAIIAPENDTEILFGNVERDVPVLFRLYPYDDGTGQIVHFTTTAGTG